MSTWLVGALITALIIVPLAKLWSRHGVQSLPRAMAPPAAGVSKDGCVTAGVAALAPVHVNSLNDRLYLIYRDGAGILTERWFTLHAADGRQTPAGVITLVTMKGYCHLRHMSRTFRLDRVVSIADADGVVIENLGAWILAKGLA